MAWPVGWCGEVKFLMTISSVEPSRLIRRNFPDRSSTQGHLNFAYTCAYRGYGPTATARAVGRDLYGARVLGEGDFRRHLAARGAPELLMMNNFIPDRAGVVSLCREHGINVVHTEDGWFPHYGMGHGDPLGFCWESSLPGLVFRECSPAQRAAARQCRREWVSFAAQALPPQVRPPFVLWPLQLTGDKVNRWDLNVEDWCGLLRHFRMSLPTVFQLVLKPHPRSQGQDNRGVAELLEELPNTVLVPAHTHLKTLLRHCNGFDRAFLLRTSFSS